MNSASGWVKYWLIVAASRQNREIRLYLIKEKKYRKIGVILKELRYSTEEDILWAIERMKRKIGEILMEKRYITDYDLTAVLSLQAS